MSRVKRNTATRDNHRRIIAATKPPCWICGEQINWKATHKEPDSFVVDHIIPLAKGGTDKLDNKAAAHKNCNRDKSDKQHIEVLKRSSSLKRPGTF